MTTMDQRPPSPRTLIGEVEGHLLIEATKAEGRLPSPGSVRVP
ncbi:hypothetical protein ACFTY8_40660 [Streptomyces mirabilis]